MKTPAKKNRLNERDKSKDRVSYCIYILALPFTPYEYTIMDEKKQKKLIAKIFNPPSSLARKGLKMLLRYGLTT
jgi:hypothetical protein